MLLFIISKNKNTANEVGKNGDERKDIVITQESQKIGIIKAKQIQIIIKKALSIKKIVAYSSTVTYLMTCNQWLEMSRTTNITKEKTYAGYR